MRKNLTIKKINLIIFVLIIITPRVQFQSTTLGHFAPGFPAFNWCGWDAATPIPFNIEHRGTQDINFKNGAFPGINRMVIKGTGAVPFADLLVLAQIL